MPIFPLFLGGSVTLLKKLLQNVSAVLKAWTFQHKISSYIQHKQLELNVNTLGGTSGYILIVFPLVKLPFEKGYIFDVDA